MKKLAILATASLMAAGIGSAAIAQTPFEAADGNGDLQITLDEAMGSYIRLTPQLFGQADADGDGWLDEGEFTLLGVLTPGN